MSGKTAVESPAGLSHTRSVRVNGSEDQIGVRVVAIVAAEMATLPLLSLIAVLVILPGASLSEFLAPHGYLGVRASPGTIFSAAAYQLARRSRRSSGAPAELGSVDTPHSSGLELMRDILRQRRSSSPERQQAPAGEPTAPQEQPLNPPENTLSQDEKDIINMFGPEPTTRQKRKTKRKKDKTTTPMPDVEVYEESTLSPEEQKKVDELFFGSTADPSPNAESQANGIVTEPKEESPDPKNKTISSQPDGRSSATTAPLPVNPSTESTTRPTATTSTTEKPSHRPGPGLNTGVSKNNKKNDTQIDNQITGSSTEHPPLGSASQTTAVEAPKTHGEPEKKQTKPEQLENDESGLKKDEETSRTTSATDHTNPTPVVLKAVPLQHEGNQVRQEDPDTSPTRHEQKTKQDTEDASAEKHGETPSSGEGKSKDSGETPSAIAMPPPSGSSTPAPPVPPNPPEVQDRTHYSHAQHSGQYVAAPDLKQTPLGQSASQSKPEDKLEDMPRSAALVGPPYLKFTGNQSGQRSQSSSYTQSLQDLGIHRQQNNQDLNTFRGPQTYQGSQGFQSSQSSHGNLDINTFQGPQSYQGSQGLQSYLNPQRAQMSQTPQGLHNSFGAGEGAPRAAAATLQRSQQGQGQASPLVFSRWFGDVMQWSDAQELLHRVKTGQELPQQDYRGVRITYKVNGYSEPPAPQPAQPTIPPYSPPLSQLVVSGYGPAAQTTVHPGALYHQQFASGHLQTPPGQPGLSPGTASSYKPAFIVVPSQYAQPSLPGATQYLAPSPSLPYQSPAASLSNAPPALSGLQGAGYSRPGMYAAPSSWSNQAQVQGAHPSMPPYLIRVYTKQEPQGPQVPQGVRGPP